MEKQYYWAEDLEDYQSDNLIDEAAKNPVIEIKRLNFFIGKNNAGKSRFLRNLFKSEIPVIQKIGNEYNRLNCSNLGNIQSYLNWLTQREIDENKINMNFMADSVIKSQHEYSWAALLYLYTDNECLIIDKEVLSRNILDIGFVSANKWLIVQLFNDIKEIISEKFDNLHYGNWDEQIKNAYDFFCEYIELLTPYIQRKDIPIKYHIPILRGMRPTQNESNIFPYITRTQKDYFNGIEHLESNQIITGENLYSLLQKQLLGKAQEWQRVRLYEQKLSQYFFNGETVTLIPELESDVLSIKIGNDEQFPISQLGDGLQQIIILTYQAFIEQDAVCSFFIEEPELHMHAGMVRQLMNFYLNETKHYYFFTTHSNHLLDMADESDEVIIQKFVKQTDKQQKTSFQIYRCDRDRDLLASLGVKPSSVYLANCTIWVEGITDRLYLLKYMEKYLQELQDRQPEKYLQYRRFMPNYHYAFVEYSGGNIVHWDFSDDFADGLADKGLSAKAIVSYMLLIADGDNRDKAARLFEWNEELGAQNVVVLQSKEMENTLPFDVIVEVAKARFESKRKNTKEGFDIEKLNELQDKNYFVNADLGIGLLLDTQIRLPETDKAKSVFADGDVGTIKDKLKFCREVIQYFDNNPDWELTAEARELCERIFQHIERCNLR